MTITIFDAVDVKVGYIEHYNPIQYNFVISANPFATAKLIIKLFSQNACSRNKLTIVGESVRVGVNRTIP